MKQYYEFLPKDGQLLPSVFKFNVGGGLRIRPIYKRFACSVCGRLDASAALQSHGVDGQYSAEIGRRNLAETYDYMYLIDSTARRLLESESDDLIYYPLYNNDNIFLIWPKVLVVPDDSAAFSRGDQCDRCRIYRTTVFGPEPLSSVSDVAAGAVLLEGPQGPMPGWFVNERLAKTLKSAKLKGMTLVKWMGVNK